MRTRHFFHGSGSGSAGKIFRIRVRLRIRPEIEMKKKIYLYFRWVGIQFDIINHHFMLEIVDTGFEKSTGSGSSSLSKCEQWGYLLTLNEYTRSQFYTELYTDRLKQWKISPRSEKGAFHSESEPFSDILNLQLITNNILIILIA